MKKKRILRMTANKNEFGSFEIIRTIRFAKQIL